VEVGRRVASRCSRSPDELARLRDPEEVGGTTLGSTSEPHAGQWKVPSGRRRISGWPHSQACLPWASGKAHMRRRVSSIAPPTQPPHDPQRIGSLPEGVILPASQSGQTR
jgi:hypothetical protein